VAQEIAMNDTDLELSDEQERTHQQAIEYGKDLARVYAAEKARRKELETAYLLLDAVINSMPDGLIVIDSDCIVQQANPAFNNMLGLGDDPVAGLHLNELPIGSYILPLLEQIEAVSFDSLQTDIKFSQSKDRVLMANIAPLRTQVFDGWVIVLHEHHPGG
jgi:PAS domain S-box-containing protein